MNRKLTLPSCEACQSRACSIFSELTKAEMDFVAESKGGNIYKRGQNIFYEGTRPSGLHCISSGKVKVYKIDHTGKEQIVRLAKAGDILGYRSLISGELYSSFAAPLEDAVICTIPKEVFFELVEKNSTLSMRLMRLLSRELRSAEGRISNMAQKTVRERLAETLLMLAEFCGFEKDGATIDVSLTREDLANIVGTATETVIRFLSEFKQDKSIDLKGRKIKVINRANLVRTANIYD